MKKEWVYNDWRLPNIHEQESLVDINTHSPAIAGKNHFKSVSPFYWSSTTSCYEPAYAWTLYGDVKGKKGLKVK
jgi:hypothetical protein